MKNNYKETRKKWARGQEELFLNILEKPEETYEQVLTVMSALMKGFRLAFYKTRKRQAAQARQRPRRAA